MAPETALEVVMEHMRFKLKLLFAATVTAALLFGCSHEEEGPAGSRPDSLPDEVVTRFVTEETDSGRIKWRLRAPKARRFRLEEVFYMDEPEIQFYDKFGYLQSTLVAQHGEYSERDELLLAYGNVVVTTVDGDILETDSLRYLSAEDRIRSDSFVKLTRGTSVVTGIGLECDHNLSSVEILRDFKATLIDDAGTTDGD